VACVAAAAFAHMINARTHSNAVRDKISWDDNMRAFLCARALNWKKKVPVDQRQFHRFMITHRFSDNEQCEDRDLLASASISRMDFVPHYSHSYQRE
jgi:hypothetical protein